MVGGDPSDRGLGRNAVPSKQTKTAMPLRPQVGAASPGWAPGPAQAVLANALLERQSLRQIGKDLIDILLFQLAFLEGIVGLDVLLRVQHDDHVRVFGDVVTPRARWIVDGKNDVFE